MYISQIAYLQNVFVMTGIYQCNHKRGGFVNIINVINACLFLAVGRKTYSTTYLKPRPELMTSYCVSWSNNGNSSLGNGKNLYI